MLCNMYVQVEVTITGDVCLVVSCMLRDARVHGHGSGRTMSIYRSQTIAELRRATLSLPGIICYSPSQGDSLLIEWYLGTRQHLFQGPVVIVTVPIYHLATALG